MIRLVFASCLVLLCSCTEPPTPDTKVIVGATLVNRGKPAIEHSVVIVKDDKIAAVGTQQMVPIPPASRKVEAYGKYIVAADNGPDLKVGNKADLVVLSSDPTKNPAVVERRMTAGQWIQ